MIINEKNYGFKFKLRGVSIRRDWNAIEMQMSLLPKFNSNPFQAFYITNSSWGLIEMNHDESEQAIRIKPSFGILEISKFKTWNLEGNTSPRIVEALINEVDIKEQIDLRSALNTVVIDFKESLKVDMGQEVILKMK